MQTFDEYVATLPEKHWSKYDIAAVKQGWDAREAIIPKPVFSVTKCVLVALLVLTVTSSWVLSANLLMNPQKCVPERVFPVENIRVFQWNQLTQEKGKEVLK